MAPGHEQHHRRYSRSSVIFLAKGHGRSGGNRRGMRGQYQFLVIEIHWDTLVHLTASVMSGNTGVVAVLARFGSAAPGEPVY